MGYKEGDESEFAIHEFPDKLSGLNYFYTIPSEYQQTVLDTLRRASRNKVFVTADMAYKAHRQDTEKDWHEHTRLEALPYTFGNSVLVNLGLDSSEQDDDEQARQKYDFRMILRDMVIGINFEYYDEFNKALEVLEAYINYPLEFRQSVSDRRTAERKAMLERWSDMDKKIRERVEQASGPQAHLPTPRISTADKPRPVSQPRKPIQIVRKGEKPATKKIPYPLERIGPLNEVTEFIVYLKTMQFLSRTRKNS